MNSIFALILISALYTVHSIRICHHNDFHARYAEINRFNSHCSEEDSLEGKCFSGIARIAKAITLLNCDLVIHTGDFVQGSVFHTVFGAGIASDAYKWVGYDVAILGNHEFNNGPDDIYEVVMRNPNTTWIASNVHFENPPVGFGIEKFVEIYDICWVSALTISTNDISMPGPTVKISNETKALRNSLSKCSQNQRVIAINHVGFDRDVQMCRNVAELDVVIGGHSHTNLDNGEYPYKVVRPDGSVCWVLHASAFGRNVGFVDISFDEGMAGLTGHGYIPMDSRVPMSKSVAADLQVFTDRLDSSIKQAIAVAAEPIDGSRESCRSEECQMGNLVCDAMLAHAGPQQGAEVCIQNGGGLRASIDEGDITIEEVLSVLPFGNVHAVLSVPGSAILAALENRFIAVSNDDVTGRFPQVGGMTVVADYSKPEGERVVSVNISGEPIEMDREYKLVTNSFVATGSDGYDWSAATAVELSGLGLDVQTQRFLGDNSPYTPFTEERIVTNTT